MPPENFIVADITPERLGPNQAAPTRWSRTAIWGTSADHPAPRNEACINDGVESMKLEPVATDPSFLALTIATAVLSGWALRVLLRARTS